MEIITTFSRGHGMALFLVLFNRCRVPLFPVRESSSALSGRARILMSGWLFKRHFLFTLCIFIFSKAQTRINFCTYFRCKASSIKTSFSLSFFSPPFLIFLIERG